MNWDDLRCFLAMARGGSQSAAGRTLGVSQPTVSRRLAAMEARLGVRLFDHIENRHVLTSAGEEIFDAVQNVEEQVAAIDRRVAGKGLGVTGELRLTCTEVMANLFLAPYLAKFVRLHPGINLSVVCTFQHLSLHRREADVAIRVTSNPPEALVGRRLVKVAMAVYAGVGTTPPGSHFPDVGKIDWIGWHDDAYNQMFTHRRYPTANIRHRVDDMLAMCAMARNGMGAAMLPCYVGDSDPGLRRVVTTPITEGAMDLWVLMHPDVRRSDRVRTFTAFIGESILAHRDLFEGSRPHRDVHQPDVG